MCCLVSPESTSGIYKVDITGGTFVKDQMFALKTYWYFFCNERFTHAHTLIVGSAAFTYQTSGTVTRSESYSLRYDSNQRLSMRVCSSY